jgi:hypothetical protein
MAERTIAQLQAEAQLIKNETIKRANTATRVGGTIENVVDSVDHLYGEFNETKIKTLSDLPTPVNGVITLTASSVIYKFSGNINIGSNRILNTGKFVMLRGTNLYKDAITSTATGITLTSTAGISLEKMSIISPLANTTLYSSGDTTGITSINTCSFPSNGGDCIVIDDNDIVIIEKTILRNFTNGIILSGNNESVLITNNVIQQPFTGTAIDLNGSTSYAISISENSSEILSGNTFLNIASGGTNVNTGGLGTVSNNKIKDVSGGTAISGYTSFETQWGVTLNDNIIDSDRLQPSGWGFYTDSLTGASSAQTITSTSSKLLIDGLGSDTNETRLPNSIRNISSLYDTTTNELIGITVGDSFDLRLEIEILSKSGNPTTLELILDIGTGATPTIEILHDDLSTAKTAPFTKVFTFPYFTLDTFIANKGKMYLATDTGTVDIGLRKLLIVRTSSGVS